MGGQCQATPLLFGNTTKTHQHHSHDQRQPMKRLALISLLAITVTACADRTRVNCERIKNKAPETIGTQTQIGGGRCA
jgi:hypothetical protein